VKRAFVSILLLTAAAFPAGAQQIDSQGYRTGLPPVMAPMGGPGGNQAPIDDGTVDRFRQAYAARKSPRIMVFWNRELDDHASSTGNVETRIERRDVGVGVAVPGAIVWGQDRDVTIRSRVAEPETTRRPDFAEPSKWAFEASFSQAFSEAGVNFIDRSLAIRTTDHASKKTGAADQARGEMAGVAGTADLLMEVLATRDPRSPVGTAFKVTVKQISSGRVLANVVTLALPPERTSTGYAATKHGFVPVTQPVTVDLVGRRLAVETMVGLLGAWR
jgi:hypothetical protein